MAFAGYGAMAIVAGSQVAALLPFSLYLLVVRRWRPATGWLRWPDWRAHAAAMRFWGQALTSGLLYSARGALEAAVLPGALGFASLGLLGRAQALHANTSGRVGNVLRDAVYPVLPRSARRRRERGRAPTQRRSHQVKQVPGPWPPYRPLCQRRCQPCRRWSQPCRRWSQPCRRWQCRPRPMSSGSQALGSQASGSQPVLGRRGAGPSGPRRR